MRDQVLLHIGNLGDRRLRVLGVEIALEGRDPPFHGVVAVLQPLVVDGLVAVGLELGAQRGAAGEQVFHVRSGGIGGFHRRPLGTAQAPRLVLQALEVFLDLGA